LKITLRNTIICTTAIGLAVWGWLNDRRQVSDF